MLIFFSSKIETACRNGFATSIIAHSAEMSKVQFTFVHQEDEEHTICDY